jgi:hypothetical protein
VAVLIEGISVVVRADRLLEAWHQDWDAFVQSVPNQTLCADGELARVGFMTPEDAKLYVDTLLARGLTYLDAGGAARDVIVVDQQRGPAAPCEWVEFGHVNLGGDRRRRVAACQLAGSTSRQVCSPDGWTFEKSLSASYGFVPTGEEHKSLDFVRHQDGLDVYLNRLTGREVFVAKTRPEGDGL